MLSLRWGLDSREMAPGETLPESRATAPGETLRESREMAPGETLRESLEMAPGEPVRERLEMAPGETRRESVDMDPGSVGPDRAAIESTPGSRTWPKLLAVPIGSYHSRMSVASRPEPNGAFTLTVQ